MVEGVVLDLVFDVPIKDGIHWSSMPTCGHFLDACSGKRQFRSMNGHLDALLSESGHERHPILVIKHGLRHTVQDDQQQLLGRLIETHRSGRGSLVDWTWNQDERQRSSNEHHRNEGQRENPLLEKGFHEAFRSVLGI